MRVIDLSLPINRRMTGIPQLRDYVNPARCVVLSGFSEGHLKKLASRGLDVAPDAGIGHSSMCRVEIVTHVGTHVDAPAHFIEDAWPIDQVPLERIVKKGRIVPLTHVAAGAGISAETILASGVEFDETVIPVLHTGWTDRAWGTDAFWNEMIYLEPSVGELLVSRGVSAVAIDCFPEVPFWRFPPDPNRPRGPNHLKLLGNKTIIIQMLRNIAAIGRSDFTLVAAPLALEGADGSPARVFAILD